MCGFRPIASRVSGSVIVDTCPLELLFGKTGKTWDDIPEDPPKCISIAADGAAIRLEARGFGENSVSRLRSRLRQRSRSPAELLRQVQPEAPPSRNFLALD